MTCLVEERSERVQPRASGALGFAWVGLIVDAFKGKQAANAATVDAFAQQAQAAAEVRAAEARGRTITTVALVGGVVGLLALVGGVTYLLGRK